MQLLEGRASMGSTVVRDRFVIFAGGTAESGRTDMINIFDVKLERFVHGYLTLARSSAKCLSIGYIAVCGGGVADGVAVAVGRGVSVGVAVQVAVGVAVWGTK